MKNMFVQNILKKLDQIVFDRLQALFRYSIL